MAVGKYDTHVKPKLLLIEAWARDGLTDEDMAKNLKISESSFYLYKSEHTEFSDSLKRGKEEVDITVENALYKRAMGYDFEEVTREPLYNAVTGEAILDEYGNPKIAITKVVRKQLAGDTTAQIFWLKNRKPGQWRDKQDIEHSGKLVTEVKHDLKKLSPEELKNLEHILTKTTDTG